MSITSLSSLIQISPGSLRSCLSYNVLTLLKASHLDLVVVLEKAVSVLRGGKMGRDSSSICKPIALPALLTVMGAVVMLLKCIYPQRPLVFKDFLVRCSI